MTARLPEELERLVLEAVEKDASDVFLIPGEPVSMRVCGLIERGEGDALSAEEVGAMALAAIGEDTLRRVGPEVGSYRRWCGVPGEYNAGITVAKSHGDYTIALRTMLARIVSAEECRMPPAMVEAALSPNGLVVTAGLAGSGKTTAAYALVDHINATVDGCHICTVEGPSHLGIAPKKALVQQREVGVDVPDVVAGIQAAASQDLDVLFVGEIATGEVLEACLTVAETGHMVITQAHASSPEDAIRRMIALLPEENRDTLRGILARVLRGVSGQVLLPGAGGKGRVAAYGVLIADEEMRQAIAEGGDFMARRTPWPGECQTIVEHVQQLGADGDIAAEVAERAIEDARPV